VLTFSPIKNSSSYAARHLSYSDYADEQAKVTGQWMGKLAAELGLSGAVVNEKLEALGAGHHPETGEKLRPRIRKDENAINLYDFTISAPKSLSMLAVIEGDEWLLAAHDRCVAKAMSEVETLAATRVRMDGANENRTTGNLAIAVYRHDTSRDLDAQVHSHCVVPNLTFDPVENRYKALKARPICEAANYATEVYRNELARELMSLGYEVETVYDENGRDAGLEIKKVDKPLRDKQSSRSNTRDELIEQFKREKGKTPTNKQIAVMIRESREDKLKEISTAEVRALQRERIGEEGRNTLHQVHKEARERGPIVEHSPALESLEYAKAHLFARRSVFREHEILTEALKHGRGRIRLDELKAAMQEQILSGELIGSGGDLATRQTLERERAILMSVNRGIGQYEKLGGESRRFQPAAEAGLNEEQRKAVTGILSSRDGVVCLQGAAGTGKTRTLGELRRGLMEGGREVFGVAPTQSAVEEMKKDGVEGSVSISNLLVNESMQEKLRGQVLFVDEAGMIGGEDMASLLQLREKLGFRMVLIGDTKQIQSVQATDSLRILQRESRLKTFELSEIQRQKGAYKKAMSALRDNPEEGFEQLVRMGAVHEVPVLDRAEAAVAAYQQDAAQPGKNGKPRSVLVVCPTWAEIDQDKEDRKS
jgi:conjugative relaxase-like TrwC/TraI family protein